MPTRQTFTWSPDLGSTLISKPTVQVTKFGDGYENRLQSGLNPVAERWSLSFSMSQAQALSAHAFLKARAASESFIWTSPHNVTNFFVCREWKVTNNSGFRVLSCDFEQVFEF